MPEILHELTILSDPEKVYEAITNPSMLKQWWTYDVEGEGGAGSMLKFHFHNRSVTFDMEVTHQAETHVRWKCHGEHEEWQNTELEFLVTRIEEGTRLRFSHTNWQRTDGILAQCSFDWARYLLSLKAVVETGYGSPHLPP